jgi:hypothetical protein
LFARIPQESQGIQRLQECHILFVSSGPTVEQTKERLNETLRLTHGGMTLVFTEIEDFRFLRDPLDRAQGVTVNFYIQNNLLKLLLNLRSVPDGVTIPERLQRLQSVTLRR